MENGENRIHLSYNRYEKIELELGTSLKKQPILKGKLQTKLNHCKIQDGCQTNFTKG